MLTRVAEEVMRIITEEGRTSVGLGDLNEALKVKFKQGDQRMEEMDARERIRGKYIKELEQKLIDECQARKQKNLMEGTEINWIKQEMEKKEIGERTTLSIWSKTIDREVKEFQKAIAEIREDANNLYTKERPGKKDRKDILMEGESIPIGMERKKIQEDLQDMREIIKNKMAAMQLEIKDWIGFRRFRYILKGVFS